MSITEQSVTDEQLRSARKVADAERTILAVLYRLKPVMRARVIKAVAILHGVELR